MTRTKGRNRKRAHEGSGVAASENLNSTANLKSTSDPHSTNSTSIALASAPTSSRTNGEVDGEEEAMDISYVSEGPTLPVIGGVDGYGLAGIGPAQGNVSSNGGPVDAESTKADGNGNGKGGQDGKDGEASTRQKKRKLNNGHVELGGRGGDNAGRDGKGKEKDSKKQDGNETGHNSDNDVLYTPWILLQSSVREALDKRRGTQLAEQCIPIAFTRNQNIKTGITKLKRHISEIRQKAGKDKDGNGRLIAVSAQGEGTTKLVGIIGLLRKIVAPAGPVPTSTTSSSRAGKTSRKAVQDVVDDGTEEWYLYTSLSSRDVPIQRRVPGKNNKITHGDGEDEEEEAFETLAQIRENDDLERDGRISTRVVPILTAWISRTSIPEFRDAFGEQRFWVGDLEEGFDEVEQG